MLFSVLRQLLLFNCDRGAPRLSRALWFIFCLVNEATTNAGRVSVSRLIGIFSLYECMVWYRQGVATQRTIMVF